MLIFIYILPLVVFLFTENFNLKSIMKHLAIFLLISAHSFFSKAPVIAPNLTNASSSFPKGYFRNPLDIPI